MTENFNKPIKRSKAVFKLKYLLGLLKKIYFLIEKWVVVIGAILLILWFIDPVRTYLTTNIKITKETFISISGIFLFVFWRLFVEVDSTLDSLSLKVDEITRTTTSDYLIPGGLNNVYDTLEDVIKENLSKPLAPTDICTYENLGLTLLTSWPDIRKHLMNQNFSQWDIRLYCLSPDFIQSNEGQAIILPQWLEEVNGKIAEIKRFVQQYAADLQRRHLSVSLVSYSHFPAIHGFRINNADILFSTIDWNAGNLVADPTESRHFYQFVSASNTSLPAHHYRLLFKSWIDRANNTGTKILPP